MVGLPVILVTSAVLAYKQPLHGLVGRLDQDDIYAGGVNLDGSTVPSVVISTDGAFEHGTGAGAGEPPAHEPDPPGVDE